jgi:ABC-2 type transport system ATP-binding protein
MLKLGKVVALDSMQGLLRRVSGSQLVVHLKSGALPESLRSLVSHDDSGNGTRYSLRVNAASEVEGILARLREGGAVVDEMQLQQADLEDIFIQIMEGEAAQ